MALENRLRALAMLALLMAAPLVAEASVYSCTADGKTYSGDSPPAECLNTDMREMNRDGTVRRVITRPPTVEEVRQRDAAAKHQAEEDERLLNQRRRDRALLEAYSTEDDIEAARKKALSFSEQTVQRSIDRIENFKKETARLDEEKEFYKKRELPESLKRSYLLNDRLISAEQKIIVDANADRDRINARYDIEAKRFHELVLERSHPAQR